MITGGTTSTFPSGVSVRTSTGNSPFVRASTGISTTVVSPAGSGTSRLGSSIASLLLCTIRRTVRSVSPSLRSDRRNVLCRPPRVNRRVPGGSTAARIAAVSAVSAVTYSSRSPSSNAKEGMTSMRERQDEGRGSAPGSIEAVASTSAVTDARSSRSGPRSATSTSGGGSS